MTHCAHTQDDTAAVMDVIARETDRFVHKDFEGWAACWVQDERAREICMSSSFGSTVLEGWTRLSSYMRNVMDNDAVCNITHVERTDINVTQSGDIAHVVYKERSTHTNGRTEHKVETRVLERSGQDWRILYASFVLHGHQQIDDTKLAVDAKGQILCARQEALQDLKRHPGLQISNNRLRATRPSWDKILQDGLRNAAQQHGFFQHYRYTVQSGQNFRLPLVLGETDDGQVMVCVLFVRDGMTFIETQNDRDIETRLNIAKSVFGLSQGQMALGHRIVCGDNLTSAAEALGISKNTVRTHLARIYAKTGINSQTALVRTLLSVG